MTNHDDTVLIERDFSSADRRRVYVTERKPRCFSNTTDIAQAARFRRDAAEFHLAKWPGLNPTIMDAP